MNKKAILFVSVSLLTAVFAFNSVSEQKAFNTVKDCTELLPQGYQFTVNIEANIDTNKATPEMSGALHMTDGTQTRNAKLSAEIEPFKSCVLKLIK